MARKFKIKIKIYTVEQLVIVGQINKRIFNKTANSFSNGKKDNISSHTFKYNIKWESKTLHKNNVKYFCCKVKKKNKKQVLAKEEYTLILRLSSEVFCI